MNGSSRIGIGFCLDSFRVGGTELNAVRTVEALDRDRFDVTIFYLSADGPLFDRYRQLGLTMHALPIRSLYGPPSIRQRFRFAGLLRRAGIRIVHTHCIYTNLFMAPVARVASDCHVISSRRWGRAVFGSALSRANRFAYRFSQQVLANSDSVADILTVHDGVARDKVIVVPNFVDDSAFSRKADAWIDEQRSAWHVPADSTVIGIVARLEEVKNHRMLLESVARLDDNVCTVIVGDGSQRESLARLAEELGISERVRFPGYIPMKANIHSAFDISVLCSNSEGFPNTVIEAMAAGTPVVATAVGGIPDAIDHDETGLLVSRGDTDGLVRSLRQLIDSPTMRKALGAAAREKASRVYSRDRVIGILSSHYEKAVTDRFARAREIQ